MIDYALEPPEFCLLFFVRKKQRRQRLVIDCRRSNCWFSPSDPVGLSTGVALGRGSASRSYLVRGPRRYQGCLVPFRVAAAELLCSSSRAGLSCWGRRSGRRE
eukprot:6855092-Pyramimonas_sp.AAC.1